MVAPNATVCGVGEEKVADTVELGGTDWRYFSQRVLRVTPPHTEKLTIISLASLPLFNTFGTIGRNWIMETMANARFYLIVEETRAVQAPSRRLRLGVSNAMLPSCSHFLISPRAHSPTPCFEER